MRYKRGKIIRESQLTALQSMGLPCFVKYTNHNPDENQGYGLAIVMEGRKNEGVYLYPANGAFNAPLPCRIYYKFVWNDAFCESEGDGDMLIIYEAILVEEEKVPVASPHEITKVLEIISEGCNYGMRFRDAIKYNKKAWRAAKALAAVLRKEVKK